MTDREHVGGERLPTITDDVMRERLAATCGYIAVLMPKTAKLIRPDVDPIVWEHGRRTFALRGHGVLAIVLPATDDSDWAGVGVGVFAAAPEQGSEILDHDPGVEAGTFTYEVHPVSGFPGSSLPA